MCCTTLFCVLALAMMSPTTSELCVLLTYNALLAICAVHGHFQLRWTLQLIKAPRISMCVFESSCRPSITLLTCMRLRFQCSISTSARSCSRWLYLSWTFFALVGRFIYLVCLLMEPATWLAVFWCCHLPQQRDAQRVPFDSSLVWSTSIRSRYGTHHGHHREGAFFYCHDRIYHPLDTAAESNRGYENNVPSCHQSLVIHGEGH